MVRSTPGRLGEAMSTNRNTFDTVRRMGLALPGATEGTTYGSPALKVHDRMFACMAIHRSAEPDTLAVRIAVEQRDELIAADPDVYYLTDHYADHPVVLVRLNRVHRDALRDLLEMAWRFESARARPRATRETSRGAKRR